MIKWFIQKRIEWLEIKRGILCLLRILRTPPNVIIAESPRATILDVVLDKMIERLDEKIAQL